MKRGWDHILQTTPTPPLEKEGKRLDLEKDMGKYEKMGKYEEMGSMRKYEEV